MIARYTRTALHNPWLGRPWGTSFTTPVEDYNELPKPSSDRENKARRQLFRLVQEARETMLQRPPF